MVEFRSLVDVLISLRDRHDVGITFIKGNRHEEFLSYSALFQRSKIWLSRLQRLGVREGCELVLQVDNNILFIEIFWACIMGKIISVPLQSIENREVGFKLQNIWKKLDNPYLITSNSNYSQLKLIEVDGAGLDILSRTILYDSRLSESIEGQAKIYYPDPDDIAFIQFSSGSTGNPKGVVLTHKNLITNIEAIHDGISAPPDGDKFLSWMPLTHDMGLIGFHLTPLYLGWSHFLMPTGLFVRFPNLWLKMISRHKITFTSSPNFGYDYLLRHFDERDNELLDLSSLRTIVNGAEPISYTLCVRFIEKFGKYGLSESAIFPVYGLAEACLAVTFSEISKPLKTLSIDRSNLKIGQEVRRGKGDNDIILVSVGRAVKNTSIQIVNEDNKEVCEGVIGIIKIKGSNVCSHYYNNSTATKEVIDFDGWLNTGDLGVIVNGHLYITSRLKDVCFVNGQTLYSHDIERVAEEVTEIELGKIVVAGCSIPDQEKEYLLAFIQYRSRDLTRFLLLANRCRDLVRHRIGVEIHKFIPVKSIPKTTSGKIQRYKLVDSFKQGEYDEILNKIVYDNTFTNGSKISSVKINSLLEKELSGLWCEVLNLKQVGVQDTFIGLGGNSLNAGRLSGMIQERYGLDVPLSKFFEYPTIRTFAKYIEFSRLSQNEQIDMGSRGRQSFSPISSVQRRLLYQWEIDKESTNYNVPIALMIRGPLDTDKLEQSFIFLLQRHESLRTSFELLGDKPNSRIHSFDAVHFKFDRIESESYAIYQVLLSLVKPFDLNTAPLCRGAIVKLGFNEHILFLDFHHIIVDGISLTILVKELFDRYRNKSLPFIKCQYDDFIRWENDKRIEGWYDQQKMFWRRLLQDPPVLHLDTDYRRPNVKSGVGRKEVFFISSRMEGEINSFATFNNITTSLFLLAVYGILLGKYSSQQDIIIGMPVGERKYISFLPIVGMFVNNLPIRVKPIPDKTFSEYLKGVRDVYFKALNNQGVLFEDMTDGLTVNQDPSHNRLFDTMFVFNNMAYPDLSDNQLFVERFEFDCGISKYDISLEFVSGEDGLRYYIEYSTQLFDSKTVKRIGLHYKRLVKEILKAPLSSIKDIQMLSTGEKNDIVYNMNRTNVSFSGEKTVHSLFEEQVKSCPDNVAVVDKHVEITYSELNKKANRIARQLIDKGLRSQESVCIYAENSVDLLYGLIGVLKAGGTFVPIDSYLPDTRKVFIYNNSRSRFLLTTNESLKNADSLFSNIGEKNIIFLNESYSGFSCNNVCLDIHANNLAYMIYTSGSTGRPKGVMIEHRSIANYIKWAISAYSDNGSLDCPLFTSISSDLTLTSIFVPLISGNTIYLYGGVSPDLVLRQIFEDGKVGMIKLTPSHLRLFDALGLNVRLNEGKLKTLVVGGEALSTELADTIQRSFKSTVEIFNEYGPTETTIGCTVHKYNRRRDRKEFVPIGKPIANTRVYVLDGQGNPVPKGVSGELFISGACVARGYWQDDELTKVRFLKSPFVRNERLYKTGDIVRILNNSSIEFRGRTDRQVKVRGHRFELEEIEAVLGAHPLVNEAVVTADKGGVPGELTLCAYYTCSTPIGKEALELYLRANLPLYMIPSYWIPLQKIPLALNGKIDSQKLIELRERNAGAFADSPLSPFESMIKAVFEEILGRKNIRMIDDFYSIGGDSIKAVQICSRLRLNGFELNSYDIFTLRTIKNIIPKVRRICDVLGNSQNVQSKIKEFSPIEKWFKSLQLLQPGHYCLSVLLKFIRPINKVLIEQSLKTIIEFYDGLQLNYDFKREFSYFNKTHCGEDYTVEVIDLSQVDVSKRKDKLESVGYQLKSKFDLKRDLLIKFVIIKFSERDQRLLCIAHHLIIDAVSWRIIFEDLYRIYTALENNQVIVFPSKTESLDNWNRFIKNRSRLFLKERSYWNNVEDLAFSLPTKRHSGELLEKDKRTLSTRMSKQKTAILVSEISKAYRSNPSIAVILALCRALGNWTNRTEFLIFLESHGRNLSNINISRTVGWFTSIYPVRLKLRDVDLSEQLIDIKDQVKKVPLNGVGYGVLKYMHDGIIQSANSQVEVRFNYLGEFNEFANDLFTYSTDNTGSDVGFSNRLSAKIDIVCLIVKGKLFMNLYYPSKAFARADVKRLHNDLEDQLYLIINHLADKDDLYLSPSDFEHAKLDRSDLDFIFAE